MKTTKSQSDTIILPESPIRPVKARAVVLLEAGEGKVGLLYLPQTALAAQASSMRGVVLAVGSGMDVVQRGNVVRISQHGGAEFRQDGCRYVIVRQKDILAKEE